MYHWLTNYKLFTGDDSVSLQLASLWLFVSSLLIVFAYTGSWLLFSLFFLLSKSFWVSFKRKKNYM